MTLLQWRTLRLALVCAGVASLIMVPASSAGHLGPVQLGHEHVGVTEMTSIRAITNTPTFYATNEWGNAIAALSYAPVGIGLYGSHEATTGEAPGVRGDTNSTAAGATGVFGLVSSTAPGDNSVAVRGINNATSGNGAGGWFRHSGSGTGVFATAAGADGTGIIASGNLGASIAGLGIDGLEASTAAETYSAGYFHHDGTTGNGVYATTNDGNGVHSLNFNGGTATNQGSLATPTAGVYGLAEVEGGNGVIGEADNGTNPYGVWGRSTFHAGHFDGDVYVAGDLTATGAKAFKIDHPLSPETKFLQHAAVESPAMMNVYNGNVTTNRRGFATVRLPRYFQALNRDFRYQLTPIGQFAQAIVAREIENNRFTIRTDEPKVKVSWQVTGVRQDAYARANPLQVELPKTEDERGKYIDPKLYGKPARLGLEYEKLQALRRSQAETRSRPTNPRRLRQRLP
jgi:hypothetical protein